MGGKGGGSISTSPGANAERLALIQGNIAQGLFNQTEPLRAGVTSALAGAPGIATQQIGLDDIEGSPLFPAFKGATERQFDLARERVLSDGSTGGALTSALGGVETGRAGALAQGQGNLAQIEFGRRQADFDRAIGVASGGATQGQSGLAAASQGFQSLQAQQLAAQQAADQQAGGKAAGAGQLVGTLGAAAIGKSSKHFKHLHESIDGAQTLAKLQALNLYKWQYRWEAQQHMGPTAEDFKEAFNVGDGAHIHMLDALGVLLASVGEIGRRLDALEAS